MASEWKPVGQTALSELVEARLQLHYAAQTVSSVGFIFVPPEPDWSHTAVGWNADLEALLSKATPGEKPCRAALIFSSFEIALLDADEQVLLKAVLEGRTVNDIYAWLAKAIGTYRGKPPGKELFRLEHELPRYKAREGEPFPFEPKEAFAELAHWFANASLLLNEIKAAEPGASDIVAWPHHFDTATLITLSGEGKSLRTIGAGLSPGDGSYHEPYWYVSPWPAPERSDLPELKGGGSWHTAGFTSAVLPDSRMDGATAAQSREFLQSAVAACHGLLD